MKFIDITVSFHGNISTTFLLTKPVAITEYLWHSPRRQDRLLLDLASHWWRRTSVWWARSAIG